MAECCFASAADVIYISGLAGLMCKLHIFAWCCGGDLTQKFVKLTMIPRNRLCATEAASLPKKAVMLTVLSAAYLDLSS